MATFGRYEPKYVKASQHRIQKRHEHEVCDLTLELIFNLSQYESDLELLQDYADCIYYLGHSELKCAVSPSTNCSECKDYQVKI